MSKRALAVPVLLLAACARSPTFDESLVDRSDGKLPEVVVPRVERAAVSVDGRLDEPAWKRAASTGMWVSPGSGKPAPQSKVNARARLLWDGERLIVGVTVWDGNPSSPFSRDDIDPHVWARASGIELMLQPGDRGDNRDYFEIQVDVAGAVWDTRFDDYNRPITGGPDDASKRFGHQDWQSRVERAVEVDRASGRYAVELALPLSAFGPPPSAGAAWRANFYSFRDGQADALAWSPILGQGNFHRASRFGRLRWGG